MRHPHPGQDEKANVIGDKVQTSALERLAPPDVTVQRSNLPGRARPPQARHHLAIDEHLLLEVRVPPAWGGPSSGNVATGSPTVRCALPASTRSPARQSPPPSH